MGRIKYIDTTRIVPDQIHPSRNYFWTMVSRQCQAEPISRDSSSKGKDKKQPLFTAALASLASFNPNVLLTSQPTTYDFEFEGTISVSRETIAPKRVPRVTNSSYFLTPILVSSPSTTLTSTISPVTYYPVSTVPVHSGWIQSAWYTATSTLPMTASSTAQYIPYI